jgi:hypothetical protein
VRSCRDRSARAAGAHAAALTSVDATVARRTRPAMSQVSRARSVA